MQVHLLGYSSFMSKKGTQCLMLAIGMEDQRWKGLRVRECFVDPDNVDGILKPMSKVEVEVDFNGRIVSVMAE